MNKVLVNLYVPSLSESFDLLILEDKKLSEIYKLLIEGISDMIDVQINFQNNIYDRDTAVLYNMDFTLKENGIGNGTKLILI